MSDRTAKLESREEYLRRNINYSTVPIANLSFWLKRMIDKRNAMVRELEALAAPSETDSSDIPEDYDNLMEGV